MSHCSARYNVAIAMIVIDVMITLQLCHFHSFGVIIRDVSLYGINDEVA